MVCLVVEKSSNNFELQGSVFAGVDIHHFQKVVVGRSIQSEGEGGGGWVGVDKRRERMTEKQTCM